MILQSVLRSVVFGDLAKALLVLGSLSLANVHSQTQPSVQIIFDSTASMNGYCKGVSKPGRDSPSILRLLNLMLAQEAQLGVRVNSQFFPAISSFPRNKTPRGRDGSILDQSSNGPLFAQIQRAKDRDNCVSDPASKSRVDQLFEKIDPEASFSLFATDFLFEANDKIQYFSGLKKYLSGKSGSERSVGILILELPFNGKYYFDASRDYDAYVQVEEPKRPLVLLWIAKDANLLSKFFDQLAREFAIAPTTASEKTPLSTTLVQRNPLVLRFWPTPQVHSLESKRPLDLRQRGVLKPEFEQWEEVQSDSSSKYSFLKCLDIQNSPGVLNAAMTGDLKDTCNPKDKSNLRYEPRSINHMVALRAMGKPLEPGLACEQVDAPQIYSPTNIRINNACSAELSLGVGGKFASERVDPNGKEPNFIRVAAVKAIFDASAVASAKNAALNWSVAATTDLEPCINLKVYKGAAQDCNSPDMKKIFRLDVLVAGMLESASQAFNDRKPTGVTALSVSINRADVKRK